MVTKPTGRPRGRPVISLRQDRERYILTWFEATSRLLADRGLSQRGLAVTLMMVMHGGVVDEPENVAAARDLTGPVIFKAYQTAGIEGSAEPRNQSAFHPLADNFARKARRYAVSEFSPEKEGSDGRWWVAMTLAWTLTLNPDGPQTMKDVSELCDIVGENEFFDRVLRRYFDFYNKAAPEPRFSLPDFIPHDGL